MTTLQSSIQMKNRTAKAGSPQAPESGGEMGTAKGGNGLEKSIAMKNRGTVPSPGVEKTNSAS